MPPSLSSHLLLETSPFAACSELQSSFGRFKRLKTASKGCRLHSTRNCTNCETASEPFFAELKDDNTTSNIRAIYVSMVTQCLLYAEGKPRLSPKRPYSELGNKDFSPQQTEDNLSLVSLSSTLLVATSLSKEQHSGVWAGGLLLPQD